jgi:hypothetical protein
MNMVSLLVLVLVLKFGVTQTEQSTQYGWIIGLVIGLGSLAAILWAVVHSKKESAEMIEAEKMLEAKANA